jgi:hypothetical protein
MAIQAWKVSIWLDPNRAPGVSLRCVDDRGRLSHFVVADQLDRPINEAIDDWMVSSKAFSEDREHLRAIGKI